MRVPHGTPPIGRHRHRGYPWSGGTRHIARPTAKVLVVPAFPIGHTHGAFLPVCCCVHRPVALSNVRYKRTVWATRIDATGAGVGTIRSHRSRASLPSSSSKPRAVCSPRSSSPVRKSLCVPTAWRVSYYDRDVRLLWQTHRQRRDTSPQPPKGRQPSRQSHATGSALPHGPPQQR